MRSRTLATSLVVFVAICGPARAATDVQVFIKDAIQGDNSEVLLGQLGQEKGSTDQIRQYGEMLVSDHTSAKKEALEVAKQIDVSPMDTPKPATVETSQKLTKLSGINFDRAFLEAMIDDHKKDIAAYTEQAKAASGPVSAMAAKQLPMLQNHLRMAQDLQGSKTGSAGSDATRRMAGGLFQGADWVQADWREHNPPLRK